MSTTDYVLLHGDALPGKFLHWNDGTTASAKNSGGRKIEVSLSCPELRLVPTILFVKVPGIDFAEDPPCIVRAVEDLLLLRVPVVDEDEYDYFIYRLGGGEKGPPPSLKLIPRTTTTFHDEDVGLLRHGEEHYIIAALIPSKPGVYALHRFDSKTDKWSEDEVPLVARQVSFPYGEIPRKSERLLFHLTSTVIPIGGEGGTMGWVDLWGGILLCDVLSTEPNLRGVPLPLPLEHLSCNNGEGTHLGCPKSIRGITCCTLIGKEEPCLKFVHLGVDAVPVEEEWQMLDWTITTWSNTKMSTSWKDWHQDGKVTASGTSISSMLNSKMLKHGLLSPGERAFNNILVSFPAPSIIDDGVVYLQARIKFLDLKVFVLALDTRENKLLGAVEFATKRERYASIVYFPSNISKYIDPEARVMRIPEGGVNDSNWEELMKYEGTKSPKFPPEIIPNIYKKIRIHIFKKMHVPSSLNDAPVST